MHLPPKEGLPIHKLSACFNKTVATYKFYWLLSIIQELEEGNSSIRKRHLFARMISNAWYTVNYFHISFGKQDLIQEAVLNLIQTERIKVNERQELLVRKLATSPKKETEMQLWHFDKNVPHWFLSPWFPGKDKKEVYSASQAFEEACLYALFEDRIEINPAWEDYLKANAKLLKDFCFWNLSLFLQARNPNVPDIPNKLIKPAVRNSLNAQRVHYWDLVVKELGAVECIYTGARLTLDNYAVEHFIPHNFVSHDLIWNLIPADKSFNSAKSDKLPPLDKYFNPFYELQKTALEIIRDKFPKNKMLEDYLTIFPDLNEVTRDKFKERIQPLVTIAANNGFQFLT